RRARNGALRGQRDALASWWVRRMVTTGAPVVERLTFGWHHFFATDGRVVRDSRMMLAQNETQRRFGRSTYPQLLTAMLGDPALLTYLNGNATAPGARNENLARELLEVFTLGHSAGWTEHDVHDAARALTGWSVDAEGTARFTAGWHDGGTKTVLGHTGDLGTDTLVGVLAAHQAAGPHLLGRWWSSLVSSSEPVPTGVQRRALAAYGPRRDLASLLQALLTDPEVEALPPSLVRAPVDWLVGAARTLHLSFDDALAGRAVEALRALGQEPFAPPNVGGWPAGRAWLSTGAAETRMATAGWLAGLADLEALADAPPSGRVELVAHRLGLPTFSDRTVVGLRTLVRDPAALVAAALVSPEYLVV
ncbi:MAG: DUF1800 domain-containing protein, partial [Actinomycetota bacterium]|nr:DUF1800 domain-containing protein [Actinomycetota bacterium]